MSAAEVEAAHDALAAELREAYRRGVEDMRERAAKVAETPGRTGREWVPESLWGTIAREIGSAIRALPATEEPNHAS